jgi:bifunctional non-homologous end joining protein LigD
VVNTRHELRVEGHDVALSNLDKVICPQTKFTKAKAVEYYAKMADAILPHLRGRALNLKRFPHGAGTEPFYQKRVPEGAPDYLRTLRLETSKGRIEFATASDAASLLWLVNLGNYEFHPLLDPGDGHPTQMVFDLDPGEGVGLLESAAVALLVRDRLEARGLKAWCKVSGGKGAHVHVPLEDASYQATHGLSKTVAQELAERHPDAIVTNMRLDLRRGKVFVDYSQNSRHKSTVAPHSLRIGPRPTVACPVQWSEVEDAVDRRDASDLQFGPHQALRRFEHRGDLFQPLLEWRQALAGSKKRRGVRPAWAPRPKAP